MIAKWFCMNQPGMKNTLLIGKPRMYTSTSALLSKCFAPVIFPDVISVTFGSEDHIRRVAPQATAASAIAFPWAISTDADAFPQTIRSQMSLRKKSGIRYVQLVIANTAYDPATAGMSESTSSMSA